jgi:hypothetical protein
MSGVSRIMEMKVNVMSLRQVSPLDDQTNSLLRSILVYTLLEKKIVNKNEESSSE